jgi:hypothetical protein
MDVTTRRMRQDKVDPPCRQLWARQPGLFANDNKRAAMLAIDIFLQIDGHRLITRKCRSATTVLAI